MEQSRKNGAGLDVFFANSVAKSLRGYGENRSVRLALEEIITIQIARFNAEPSGKGIRSRIQIETGSIARLVRDLLIIGRGDARAVSAALSHLIKQQNEFGATQTINRLEVLLPVRSQSCD